MNNFFKGVLGGIGNIVPGLSGSALLVIFGIYKNCLNAITELVKFKNIKKNIFYLMPIGLGVVVGTILFGNVIKYLLDIAPMPTSYAFLGFIVGTLPMLFVEANKEKFQKRYLIGMVITFAIGITLLVIKSTNIAQVSELTILGGIILGFVLASSTIIPGISSTVLLTLIGLYEVYLTAIAKVDVITLLPVGIGFGIGAIFFAFLMNFLLKKYYGFTFYAICGFVIATIPAVIRGSFNFNLETFISIAIAICTFVITKEISKIKKSN